MDQQARVDPGDPDALLTLHEAADLLKVHYMTVYRWTRLGQLPALKAGSRLRVRRVDLQAFLARRHLSVAVPGSASSRRSWREPRARLVDHLLAGDVGAADALVREVQGAGATAGEIYLELLTPALHEVGRRWAANEIDVAVEHRTSGIAQDLIARLSPHFRAKGTRGVAVTMTPPGEQHGIAASMVADFVRSAGWVVHHLGVDVPVRALGAFCRREDPGLVCVSATAPVGTRILTDLDEVTGEATVVLGGQGVSADMALPVGMRVVASPLALREELAAV